MEDIDYCSWFVIFSLTIYIIKQATLGEYYDVTEDLTDKTIIITGANSGIGYQTALYLAHRNADIILACRDSKRGMDATQSIQKKTSNKKVRYRQIDLASFRSIRHFCDVVKNEEKSIYALVNNAGIFWCPFTQTQNNIEANFGINHLGHFLLSLLLLPLLNNEKSGSRIVTVTSIMHIFARTDFLSDINYTKKKYDFESAYSNSKLANVLFTKMLAKKLNSTNIKTCCVDPGIILTDIGRNSGFMSSNIFKIILHPIVWLLFKTAYSGAQTSVYCVCAKDVEKYSGHYFSECEHRYPWSTAYNEKLSRDLWMTSVQMTGINENELLKELST